MIWRLFCRVSGWSPGWGYGDRREVDDLLISEPLIGEHGPEIVVFKQSRHFIPFSGDE